MQGPDSGSATGIGQEHNSLEHMFLDWESFGLVLTAKAPCTFSR